jgi:hypothetical protein
MVNSFFTYFFIQLFNIMFIFNNLSLFYLLILIQHIFPFCEDMSDILDSN